MRKRNRTTMMTRMKIKMTMKTRMMRMRTRTGRSIIIT
jgi:hypothetical protein